MPIVTPTVMDVDRCPACEAVMHELYCYDCLTLERIAASIVVSAASMAKRKTHCHQGHEFTADNTRIDRSKGRNGGGYQVCKACHNEHCASRRARKAAERATRAGAPR